jgi:hypothetical protein
MEKSSVNKVIVNPQPNGSMDVEINGIPVLNLSRSEVEELSFHFSVAMMEQDIERHVKRQEKMDAVGKG